MAWAAMLGKRMGFILYQYYNCFNLLYLLMRCLWVACYYFSWFNLHMRMVSSQLNLGICFKKILNLGLKLYL